MKKVGRWGALLLSMTLLISLSACSDRKLVGVWKAEYDLSDTISSAATDSVAEEYGVDFADYLSELKLTYVLELRSDGSYLRRTDETSLIRLRHEYETALTAYYTDFFQRVIDKMGTRRMTPDHACRILFQIGFEEFLENTLNATFDETAIREQFRGEGKYVAEGGRLYLSDSPDHDVDRNVYENYSLKNGVLLITKGEGTAGKYPVVMTRLS